MPFAIPATIVAESWSGVSVGAGVVRDVCWFGVGEEFGGLAAGVDVEGLVLRWGAALDG